MTSAILALALLTAPQLTGPQIYDKCVENLRTYRSVSGRIEMAYSDGKNSSRRFRILAPDCYEIIDADYEIHQMGTRHQVYFPKQKQYVPPTKAETVAMSGDLLPFTEILQKQTFEVDPAVGSKMFANQEAYVLRAFNGHIELYVSKDTFQPLGYLIGGNVGVYRDVKTNEPMPRGSFVWSPPKGSTPMEDPQTEFLMGPGDTAPDFDLKLAGGSRQTLKSLLNGKKGLWLNFWFIGCVPCEEELTYLAPKMKALEGQGLNFATANSENAEPQILEFLKKKGWDFPVLLDKSKVSKAYGITAVPTNYIIDPNGEVVAAVDGFDQARIKAALAKIGIVWPG